jgi:hypothetical protein
MERPVAFASRRMSRCDCAGGQVEITMGELQRALTDRGYACAKVASDLELAVTSPRCADQPEPIGRADSSGERPERPVGRPPRSVGVATRRALTMDSPMR